MDCLYYAYKEACDENRWIPSDRIRLFRALRVSTSGDGGTFVGTAEFILDSIEAASFDVAVRLQFKTFFAPWNSLGDLLSSCENELARSILYPYWRKGYQGWPKNQEKKYIVLDLGTNHAYWGFLRDAVYPQAVIDIRREQNHD